ncbi:UDP-N-acetylmuramate--L-alanine ligase [Paractinoplanes lichenicola]|uniref:UDP-N-acetylmuramoyl-L-alanine--D-glutamate ligase n=1 Tax=Paractinoplanes lichenicola TaxID=2802976 RepID=A0ABS1W3Q8_9ACTN|nr:Mur ligase domain-containing protein [Actinoplanes lichenicola]MBL7261359.1 UDP-N-acetylmuramoyl-L-alanine--D-glutamate ligase [Actinoplanes lichenicola]
MGDTVTANPTLNAYAGPIDLSRPHFVGVGGSAMSGLAQLCAARGSDVSGTDAVDSPRLSALREAGCSVKVGHDAAAIDGASCVIYTSVAGEAPETAAARQRGIPVVHRMQVVQHLAHGRELVAVAGTHGKSTTTGMLVAALRQLGQDPSFLVGADLTEPGTGTHSGGGDLFVAEADESDRAFHFLTPAAAVVTTIAFDHPENYTGLDDHIDAYLRFASGIRAVGVLVVNADDQGCRDLTRRVRVLRPDLRVVTFGRSATAAVRLENISRQGWSSQVTVAVADAGRCVIRLASPSAQHAQDAVAALALLVALGHPPVSAAEAVSAFAGVRRRFTRVGQMAGVTVIDCHADHHNEIAADLSSARAVAGDGRVIAVVQPSGYARVQVFGADIGAALAAGADCTIMLDVAGAAPIAGVTRSIVGDAVIMAGASVRFATHEQVPALVSAMAGPGDVVVLLGVGNVGTLAAPIIAAVGATVEVPV